MTVCVRKLEQKSPLLRVIGGALVRPNEKVLAAASDVGA